MQGEFGRRVASIQPFNACWVLEQSRRLAALNSTAAEAFSVKVVGPERVPASSIAYISTAPDSAVPLSILITRVSRRHRHRSHRCGGQLTMIVFSLEYLPRTPSMVTSPTSRYSPAVVGL